MKSFLKFLWNNKKERREKKLSQARHRLAFLKMIIQEWNEKLVSGQNVPRQIHHMIKDWNSEKSSLEAKIKDWSKPEAFQQNQSARNQKRDPEPETDQPG